VLTGIVFKASPTLKQKKILSEWMGCSRFLWNAKCEEEFYLRSFAKRYLPTGTYPEIDQKFSKYKSRELSPWLFQVPSQILRNSSYGWYQTYRNFLKGICGRPKRKRKSDTDSVHLTRELFRFEKGEDGVVRLFIGTKSNNIGFLSVKFHRKFKDPNSMRIKKKNGKYTVCFCYEDAPSQEELFDQKEHLKYLNGMSKEELERITVGIDRGVKRPIQAGSETFDLSEEQKRQKKAKEKYIKRCQRRLAKQQKGSKRRGNKKIKISKAYEKISNIRKDFCHKASRTIVDHRETKVIILEDLKTKQMTQRPLPKKDGKTGKWLKNQRKAKAGLNRSILDKNWHQFELFIRYKSHRAGKALFKVPAHHTSQECADCGHTHPDNRKTQQEFICGQCGHSGNADRNAAEVIKKRAINLILDSGTELSDRDVLLDSGRGAAHKTRAAIASRARGIETSKKKASAATAA